MAQGSSSRIAHLCLCFKTLSSTCHVSFLAAPDTVQLHKISVTYLSCLSNDLTDTYKTVHGRVADQRKSPLSHNELLQHSLLSIWVAEHSKEETQTLRQIRASVSQPDPRTLQNASECFRNSGVLTPSGFRPWGLGAYENFACCL